MTDKIIETVIDTGELLNKTYEINVMFRTMHRLHQELYQFDPGIEEEEDGDIGFEFYEFSKIVLALIPFINSRLSSCEGFLPDESLSEKDIRDIREEPGIEDQYQENLEIILPLILKIISVVNNKRSLLSISEMLCHLYCIGSLFIQIPEQNRKLIYLVERLRRVNSFVNEKMNCHFDQEFQE